MSCSQVFVKASLALPRAERTLLSGLGLNTEARRHMNKFFSESRYLSELLSPQTRPLFEDAEGRVTLAFELVETMVCAAAERFVGNTRTAFAAHVCYERHTILERQTRKDRPVSMDYADIDSENSNGHGCQDLYDRPHQKGRMFL